MGWDFKWIVYQKNFNAPVSRSNSQMSWTNKELPHPRQKKMNAPHLYEMDRLGQTARHCAPSTACQQAGPRETVAPSGCSGKETAASLSAAGSRVLRFRECKSIFQTSEEYMNLKECQQ